MIESGQRLGILKFYFVSEDSVLQIWMKDWKSLACCPQEIVLVTGKGWTKQDDKQRRDFGS